MTYSPYQRLTGEFKIAELLPVGICLLEEDTSKNRDFAVKRVADLAKARPDDLTFLANKNYIEAFKETQASVCILHPDHLKYKPRHVIALLSDNPYASFARIVAHMHEPFAPAGRKMPTALVMPDAQLGENVTVDHNTIVEQNALIWDNSVVGTNCYIGRDVKIGKNTYIGHNVSIEHAEIGDNCIIHSGTRIGQDGFGFATNKGEHIKVLQLGRVYIGNNVEIGANCCIDRGSGPNTIINDNCKIDNMVQIAHNVRIGKGCLIAGQSGIAGSTEIGDYVAIGGHTAIAGHLKIGNRVQIAGKSGVVKNVSDGETVGGYPAVPIRKWHRQSIFLKKNS